MPDNTGWAIQTTRCKHLDSGVGVEVYAVNLVMPWSRREDGGDTQDSLDGRSRGPAETGSAAYARVGKLLLPWHWQELTWQVFFGHTGSWRPVVAEKPFLSGTQVDCPLPVDEIGDEIASKTHDCPFVFSVRGDDIDAPVASDARPAVTKRSLPHAMAPLTHWPAAASNRSLRLAGFVMLAADDLVGVEANDSIVCFPQFKLDGGARYVVSAVTDVSGGPPRATYAAWPELVMACMPAGRQSKIEIETAASASQGDTTASSARALAARQLAPLQLLARGVTQLLAVSEASADAIATKAASDFIASFATDAGLRAEWGRVLWQQVGTGWGAPYDGLGGQQAARHLLQRLVPEADRAKALLGVLAPPNATALEAAFASLVKHEAGANWPALTHDGWVSALSAWNELSAGFMKAGTTPLGEGRRFVQAWLEVARAISEADTRRQLLAPWMGALLGPFASPEPDWAKALRLFLASEIVTGPDAEDCMLGLLSSFVPELLGWLAQPRAGNGGSGHAADIVQALNKSWLQALPSLKDAPVVAEQVKLAVNAFEDALQHLAAPAAPRPRDPGLTLAFETTAPADPTAFDQSVRGYAIALCSLMPTIDRKAWRTDQSRAQWITDTAVYGGSWLKDANSGKTCWMHETVGSTLRNGLRVTSVEYEGEPIAAMQADEHGALFARDPVNGDPDGSDAIDFLWRRKTEADPQGRELPLLGYGLHYRAEATCLDNAGGVFDPVWRIEEDNRFTELIPAVDVFPNPLPRDAHRPPQWQYRSAVPPGAPAVRTVELAAAAFELSDETRAHAFELNRRRQANEALGAPLPKVALLTHDEQLPGGFLFDPRLQREHGKYTVTIQSPAASAEFVERWLNTDIVWRELLGTATTDFDRPDGGLSDPLLAGRTAAQLIAFRDSVTKRIRQYGPAAKLDDEQGLSWHPAVSAIGVAVWADGAPEPLLVHPFPIDRSLYVVEKDVLLPGAQRHVTLDIAAAGAGAPTTALPGQGAHGTHTLSIRVARGSFVRVRAFSLVDGRHFDSSNADDLRSPDCRFYAGIELSPSPESAVPVFNAQGGALPYRAFGPSELWFEAAPAWTSFAPAEFALQVVAPNGTLDGIPEPLSPGLMALQGVSPMAASWVKGLFVQRHEWHWTGYPVRLPGATTLAQWPLADWLVSFAGVESYREGFEAPLTTGFDGASWKYGAAADGRVLIHRRPLQGGARPARYAAYTARSMVRFRAWLDIRAAADGPLALEQKVYAAGTVIPGTSATNLNERLPTPQLRWAVPLTSTYRFNAVDGSSEPRQTARGNLLVCDGALRRTDEGARIGGIGDTLEIDLLHTRNRAYREIGLNPIFHGHDAAATFQLDVHPPFGLTHDITSNALVAQTGVVVSTRGGEGRWLLAKIRTRRLLLPETLLDSALPMIGDSESRSVELPLRRDGDDTVPCDFALDAPAAGMLPQFEIRLRTTPDAVPVTLQIVWPAVAGDPGEAIRYLCSWHKDRWDGGGDPTWRLQVLGQRRPAGDLAWMMEIKSSGFEQAETQLPARTTPVSAQLLEHGAARFRPSIVRMSDYTDPIWLTFIGSFGRESLRNADAYWLGVEGQSLVLHGPPEPDAMPQLSAMASTAAIAQQQPRFQLLLVYRPLADVTRGDIRADTGALVGVFLADGAMMRFRGLRFNNADSSTNIAGCYAYLCSVQRITSASAEEEAILQPQSFEALVALLFPDEGKGESLLRLLPEYLGPIAVGDPTA